MRNKIDKFNNFFCIICNRICPKSNQTLVHVLNLVQNQKKEEKGNQVKPGSMAVMGLLATPDLWGYEKN